MKVNIYFKNLRASQNAKSIEIKLSTLSQFSGIIEICLGENYLKQRINELVLRKRSNTNKEAHWEIYLVIGKREDYVMIDLMEYYYRVICGASIDQKPIGTSFDDPVDVELKLISELSLSTIIEQLMNVGVAEGKWNGVKDDDTLHIKNHPRRYVSEYNCQDFALAFLAKIGVPSSDLLAHQQQRQEFRHPNFKMYDRGTAKV